MTLIDQRPIEVQMRLIPGHWKGDLIIGKGNLSQVGTLVERTTLFVALVKLDSSKADVTAEAFTKILNRFDSQMRRSMTYDQGSEMRHHKVLTANTGVDVYFAHPHAPWERGINENTNGLLRQYAACNVDEATGLLKQVQEFTRKIHLSVASNRKRLKNTEIQLRHAAFRLAGLLHSSSVIVSALAPC